MRKLTCMRMSAKMTILFSVIAACMIAVNSVLATLSEIQNILLYEEDNLNAMASKIVAAFEQNITVMGYALDGLKQDNDFMAALNTIYTLGEDMETTSEYHQAQNTLSAALFHEPLNDYFYRINVLTMDGFYLSSRYETIGLLENYSDELRTVMLRLPYLNERNRGLSQKTLVRPHIDPWFVARRISIYTLMSPAVYHGKQIGFVEVNALSTDLFDIFSSNDMAGFRATAYDADGRLFHRSFDDTIDYSAAEYGSMTECSDKNGDTYYVVKEHCSWLGFDIYAAQRTAVFESSIHSVILHHVLVSLLVLFIAEVFIILSSHQLSRSILRLTRKVSQLSDPAAIAERPLLPEEMPKVTNPRDVEMRELEDVFDKQVMELKTAMRNDAELRESNLRSRLNALQAQINPHFIYNTLNIISAKSMEAGNEEVIDICGKFAQMLRYSTDLRSKTATLQEEIAHVRNYLALAKARLEDRLEYTIDIPDAFSHLTLPKLSLQPIAENAISHGYQGSSGTIHITISGTVDEDGCLHLLICDDGCGFGEEILSHLREEFSHIEAGELTEPENTSAHIGLINTYRRLFYFSRGAIRMRVRNDGGAVVELIETRTSEEEDDVHHSDRR